MIWKSTSHVGTPAVERDPFPSTMSVENVITTDLVLYATELAVLVPEDVSPEVVTPLTITSSEMSMSLVEGLWVTPAHIGVINGDLLAPVLTEVIILVAATVSEATNVITNFTEVFVDFHSISVESIHMICFYQCMSCLCVALCLRYGW